MSSFNVHAAAVQYPTKEWGTAFVPPNRIPFTSAVIGVTYPFSNYRVTRKAGRVINVFEYILEGEGEILINEEWHKIKAGDCTIVLAGEYQDYRSNPSNPMKKIWINYVADYIAPMLSAYGICTGIYRADDIHTHFYKLRDFAEECNDSPDINHSIAECLHSIIHALARSLTPKSDDEYGIKKALASRVYGKLNLDELAADLHISKSQIIRTFKKVYNSTPYECFLELKINTAKILLRDTKMQIREIAEKLAICDEHYFSALFHSRVGMTPRAYRTNKNK